MTNNQGSKSVQTTHLILAITAGLLLVVLALLSIRQQDPPRAVTAAAVATEFSSGRALAQLQAIAQKPHPIGSLAHQEVRDYILSQLSTQGVRPEVQESTVAQRRGRSFAVAATVRNIVARLGGTENKKAILLVGHYDSAPNSFGASDDGSGVVVLLETLRALKSGPALKNDVIFLFTDGEEIGLLGAKAFVDEHPWAKDVGLVLNFEARGNSGPAIMFETTNANGWLISEFARAAPFPVATSLTYEIYKFMGNDTDLTVFKGADLAGFNFAYIKGLTHYHTLLDSVPNIDERSLQHQGSYALSLTRHFGGLDLTRTREKDAVYFSLGPLFVHYARAWVIPLLLQLTLLFAAIVWFGFREKQLNLSGIGLGFLALFLCAVVTGAAASFIWSMIGGFVGSRATPHGDTYHRDLFLMFFVALTFAVTSGIVLWFRNRIGVRNLAVGVLFWWLLLLFVTALLFPGGSYLLMWPLFFALLGLGLMLKDGTRVSGSRFVVLFICAVPAVVLLAPAIYLIFVGLNMSTIGLVMILVVLLLGLIMPLLDPLLIWAKWFLPGAALALCLALFIVAVVISGFDRNHPRQDYVFYHLDVDKQEGAWLSNDQQPDAWTSQFFPANTPRVNSPELPLLAGREWLKNPAPVAQLEGPKIDTLDDQTSDGLRTLRLRISSPRHAPIVSVTLDRSTEVTASAVNGKLLQNAMPPNQWGLRYFSLPPAGIELTLTIRSAGPVKIRVMDQSYGLPELPGTVLKPRPDGFIPAPYAYSDLTLVDKLFTF